MSLRTICAGLVVMAGLLAACGCNHCQKCGPGTTTSSAPPCCPPPPCGCAPAAVPAPPCGGY